jgi:hypothetical protein
MTVYIQHPQRVRLECHGNRSAADGIGPFDDLVKQGLMTDVHPVEVADGNHGLVERLLEIFQIFDQFHDGHVNQIIPLTDETKEYS